MGRMMITLNDDDFKITVICNTVIHEETYLDRRSLCKHVDGLFVGHREDARAD